MAKPHLMRNLTLYIGLTLAMMTITSCTAFYVPTIGERVNVPAEYQRALRLGNHLILFYRTDVRAGVETVNSGSSNWSSIALSSINWNMLDAHAQVVLSEHAVVIEEDPPPEITIPPYTDIPIYHIELGAHALDHLIAHMRESVMNTEVSVTIVLPNLMPIIVRRQDDGKVFYRSVHIQGRHYRTWWALPARAAVIPGALAVDSVTWPV